jgi:hypothetical protein
MRSMPRPRNLLWVTTATSCLLAGGPEDGTQPRRDPTDAAAGAPLGPEQALGTRRVRAALWPNLRREPYRALAPEQVAAAGELLAAATRYATGSGDAEPLSALALAAGLVLERWEIEGHHYIAVLEGPATRGSVGSFVLRIGPKGEHGPERVLQAPHAHFDVGTGELALQLLLAQPTRFRGLFTNTLHRYMQADGHKERRDFNPADVCHNDAHAFVAATAGAVAALGVVEVIQLHGYGEEQAAAVRPELWAIVSNGDAERGVPRVTEVATALTQGFDEPIARFPEDVAELGGTTNVIGRRVRAAPGASFLHLELSSDFRQALRRHPDWPERFAAALTRPEDREPAPSP